MDPGMPEHAVHQGARVLRILPHGTRAPSFAVVGGEVYTEVRPDGYQLSTT